MVKEMAAKQIINLKQLKKLLHQRMMENRPETEEKEIPDILEKRNGKKLEVT